MLPNSMNYLQRLVERVPKFSNCNCGNSSLLFLNNGTHARGSSNVIPHTAVSKKVAVLETKGTVRLKQHR